MADERIKPVDEAQLLRAACCDWRLSRGHLAVYAVMLEHANAEWQTFVGPKTMSRLGRLALPNVKASVRRLEELKYIKVTRPGLRKKNLYQILEPPDCPSRKTVDAMKKINQMFKTSGIARIPSSGQSLGSRAYLDGKT